MKLYTAATISAKRNILMNLLEVMLDASLKGGSVDLWKLHIDAALDRLDDEIYKPMFHVLDLEARKDELKLALTMKGKVVLDGVVIDASDGNKLIDPEILETRLTALESK